MTTASPNNVNLILVSDVGYNSTGIVNKLLKSHRNLWARYVAEFIGTFFLAFAIKTVFILTSDVLSFQEIQWAIGILFNLLQYIKQHIFNNRFHTGCCCLSIWIYIWCTVQSKCDHWFTLQRIYAWFSKQ